MKNILILLFSLLISSTAFSQDFEITWGSDVDKDKRLATPYFVGFVDNGYLVLTIQSKGGMFAALTGGGKQTVFLQKFDLGNKLLKEKELAFKGNGEELDYEDFIFENGELDFIASYYNKSTDTKYAFKLDFDMSKFNVYGKAIKIQSHDSKTKRASGGFWVEMSPDKSKILVISGLPSKIGSFYGITIGGKNAQQISYSLFDSEYNLIKEVEDNLPYIDRKIDVSEYKVNNDGDIFVSGMVSFKEGKERKDFKGEYKVFAYLGDSKDPKEFSLSHEGRLPVIVSMEVNAEGNLNCIGMYAEEGEGSRLSGAFSQIVNIQSGKIENFKSKKIGNDVLSIVFKPKAVEKGKKDNVAYFEIYDVLKKDDGGLILLTEQREIIVTTYTDANGNTKTRTTYKYSEGIVVDYAADGSVNWISGLDKNQSAASPYYLSYAYHYSNKTQHLNLIFWTKDRNSSRNDVKMLTMDNSGKIIMEQVVFNNKEADTKIRPAMCEIMDDNRLLIYGENKKDSKYGVLKFK